MNAVTASQNGPQNELQTLLNRLELGAPQAYGSLTVIPLLAKGDGGVEYLCLPEALETGKLVITEVNQHGSVPELKAVNLAPVPVLVVDGEAIDGAKQNRVLNASLLLKENSETVIPVSCTEGGRWRYQSPQFHDSQAVMAQKSRARKLSSVTSSLQTTRRYQSDQAGVWQEVAALHEKTGTTSPTGAMKDAFDARRQELDACLAACQPVAGQSGLLVLFNDRVAGFDFVSRPAAYARLHQRLLKSYAIEILFQPRREPPPAAVAVQRAREFLAQLPVATAQRYPSVGYGQSLRFQSQRQTGAALVHQGEVIHAAALNPHADEEAEAETPHAD